MKLAHLILTCSILAVGQPRGSPQMKRVVSLSKLGNCVDRSTVDNYMTNTETIQYGRTTRVSGDYIVNERIGNNSRQKINILKCSDRDGNNCEHFIGVKFNPYCVQIMETDSVWTPFYTISEPPFLCPLKGTYKFRNATLDAEIAWNLGKHVPTITVHHWKIQMNILSRSRTMGCVEFMMKFDKVRAL